MNRVLVLETDASAGRLCQRILSGGGYEAVLVETVDDCLARLAAERFGILLTEFRMPGIDVDDLLARVAQLSPETKIVIATGYVPAEKHAPVSTAGIAAWIEKPFTLADFLQGIGAVAGRGGRAPDIPETRR